MRILLIAHAENPLNAEGIARWLNSFSTLAGVVLLQERKQRRWKRVKREIQRIGVVRFLDVLVFRLHYRLFLRQQDHQWEQTKLAELQGTYPPLKPDVPRLYTHSPNTPEAEQFIRAQQPDLVLARCKTLLKESVFSIPPCGTFVMHPGICPEYRDAHGCFWALAKNDPERVGMTLLRINKGVDTGPVYGYYYCRYDAVKDSHIVIQHKVALDNLDALQDKLTAICAGQAQQIDTRGRPSNEWGQPWLTAYLAWRRRVRRGR